MTVEEKRVAACELRARGMLLREIAAELGVSMNKVSRYLREDVAEKARESSRAAKARRPRGVCGECGGPTSQSKKGGFSIRCQWCIRGVPLGKRPELPKAPRAGSAITIPDDVERREPPRRKMNGTQVSASQILATYDCQWYGCVDDALAGEAFCRSHLDRTNGRG